MTMLARPIMSSVMAAEIQIAFRLGCLFIEMPPEVLAFGDAMIVSNT